MCAHDKTQSVQPSLHVQGVVAGPQRQPVAHSRDVHQPEREEKGVATGMPWMQLEYSESIAQVNAGCWRSRPSMQRSRNRTRPAL